MAYNKGAAQTFPTQDKAEEAWIAAPSGNFVFECIFGSHDSTRINAAKRPHPAHRSPLATFVRLLF